MLRDPDQQTMQRAYARWAPVYDRLCGPIFADGRHAAAQAARKIAGRILEIGVGTGLSFDDYDTSTEIIGIDMSEPMIARARKRLESGRYPFVKELSVMDAHNLTYRDATFDGVVGQFIITLVENPECVLSECVRVLKPDGRSSPSTISTQRRVGPLPSSACWHKKLAHSGCVPSSRSKGSPPGRRTMATPNWSSDAGSTPSTRWCVFAEPCAKLEVREKCERSQKLKKTVTALRCWLAS